MAYIRQKRNRVTEYWAKQKAEDTKKENPRLDEFDPGYKDDPNTTMCVCGREAELKKEYPRKRIYECSFCDAVSVVPKNSSEVSKSKKEEKQKEKDFTKNVSKNEKVNVLRKHMTNLEMIDFEYISKNGTKSSRTVEPYKLDVKNGEIYLWAFCSAGEGIRMFKLSGIRKIASSGFNYKPRYPLEDNV